MPEYRIAPDFVPPEPTGADMFAYLTLEENSWDAQQEKARLLHESGAQFFRFTLVDEEHPHPPYAHGVWIEGWKERHPRPIPFGTSEKKGGAIYPPLSAKAK